MKRFLCLCVALFIVLCAAFSSFAAVGESAKQEEAEETSGLWILTPKVPRAVKYLAYTETREGYGEDVDELEDPSWHMCVEDGDLDGLLVPELLFQELTYDLVGTPFSCYDENGNTGSVFYFAEIYNGYSAAGIGSVKIFEDDAMPLHPGNETVLYWSGWLSISSDWINALALNPVITKENPLVLYQVESGLAGVTLDGSFYYVIKTNKGYVPDEVTAAALKCHAKRKKTVQEGEEVVQANRLVTEKDLKNPYIYYAALLTGQNIRLNEQLKNAGYDLGDFGFYEKLGPKTGEISYYAKKEIGLSDGACTVTAAIAGEDISVEAVVKKDNYARRKSVEKGDTLDDVTKWAKNEMDLYAFKLSMLEQSKVSVGECLLVEITTVPDDYLSYLLGKYAEQWKSKGNIYLLSNTLIAADQPAYYSLCVVAQYSEGVRQADISVYAGFSDRNKSVIQAKKNEPLSELLARVRKTAVESLS